MMDTPNEMVIACGTDDGYAMQMLIMLQSLVRSQPAEIALTIYMIDGGITAQNKAKIDALLVKRDAVRYHWLSIQSGKLVGMMENPWITHLSSACLLRLFLPEMLPPDVSRVLYVDSDVVVQKSLLPLYNSAFGEHFLVASPDLNVPYLRYIADTEPSLPAGRTTFNTGIMLMNVARFRETGAMEQVFSVMKNQPTWSDQEGLNAVFFDSWTPVSFLYNLQSNVMWMDETTDSETKREITQYGINNAWNDAAILHFTTQRKPWGNWRHHSYKSRYEQWMRESGWFTQAEWIQWKTNQVATMISTMIANRIPRTK